MKDKIRVALVIPDLHIGGAERLLVDMVSTWQQQGEPIKGYVYSFKGGPIRDELEAKGCSVSLSPGSYRINPLIILWLVWNFIKDSIQIVHLHLPRAGFYGRLAACILRRPILYTEHNLWEMYSPVSRFLNKITYFLNTQVVTVSDAVMASVRRHSSYPAARLTRIYNGISPNNEPALGKQLCACEDIDLPDDAMVVGTIANLHRRKGLKFLLYAIKSLLEEFPNLHCVIIGRDDGEGTKLRHIAQELRINRNVHWLGYRSDARRFVPAFDIFVLPSLFEGMPIVLIEAMTTGLPIVATRVGGNPEIINHGETGLVVEPGDASCLGNAIRVLLIDPSKRAELGNAAKERMRTEFTIDRTARSYAELYKSLRQHIPNFEAI
jgi:glycosyltransferase involved in cell wall biosynthesis